MNTWTLIVTEHLADLLSMVVLIGTNICLLSIRKNNLRDSLAWSVFIIGTSILMLYIFLGAVVNTLYISSSLTLLKDLTIALSGLAFLFFLFTYTYPEVEKNE